ncbi:hypothetical protein PR001_g4164 [Phytophthora rubi]|uniref:Alpha-L-rhamnosidase C-terminal domain-containing protein n=1 Tax=Phytophthora rubi TaxID=129364 RepID=A0A6A3NSK2_9STRA|nr:hypothetical protein PR002_g3567 [Phytophthora rubi]KAE9047548.1 hypothetical protein PR001_g4164 [Phytophthora rubi]
MIGFLLAELLKHGYTDQDALLLGNLWDAMISNELYCSGASWEYRYVTGIRPVEFGFRHGIVNPLATGLDITSANATVSTPYGPVTAACAGDDPQLC